MDSTFQFERKRNRPVRYNRDLVQSAIKTIKRVDEIRMERKKAFYKKRMDAVKAVRRAAEEREIKTHISLIAPVGTADLSVEEMASTVVRVAEKNSAKRAQSTLVSSRARAESMSHSDDEGDYSDDE